MMEQPQAMKDRKKLPGISSLLTELLRPRIGISHFRGCGSFCDLQGSSQGELYSEFLLHPFRRIRERGEQLQGGSKMMNGLRMSRILRGLLTSFLQKLDRLLDTPAVTIVMRELTVMLL